MLLLTGNKSAVLRSRFVVFLAAGPFREANRGMYKGKRLCNACGVWLDKEKQIKRNADLDQKVRCTRAVTHCLLL